MMHGMIGYYAPITVMVDDCVTRRTSIRDALRSCSECDSSMKTLYLRVGHYVSKCAKITVIGASYIGCSAPWFSVLYIVYKMIMHDDDVSVCRHCCNIPYIEYSRLYEAAINQWSSVFQIVFPWVASFHTVWRASVLFED